MSLFEDMDKIKADFESVIARLHNHAEENMGINIIIDDSDPQDQVFVEIENDDGESISIGESIISDDGYRKLRISTADIINHLKI